MGTMTLRLRQICVVAPQLEPAVDAVADIFGLEVCHRDPAVAKYGLANALFVFGCQFLEIVAPIREGTAAGRFLDRSGGRGGYILIFDTSDPERRRAHVEALGVRVAHTMDYPGAFYGIQLHPRDCRATMLEFDRSVGNEHLDGAYWPAGHDWQHARRPDRAGGIAWVDVDSPNAQSLAAHWARIIDRPLERNDAGDPVLRFDIGAVRFLTVAPGVPEHLSAVHVEVDDPDRVRSLARARGCATEADGFVLCGVRIVPHVAGEDRNAR